MRIEEKIQGNNKYFAIEYIEISKIAFYQVHKVIITICNTSDIYNTLFVNKILKMFLKNNKKNLIHRVLSKENFIYNFLCKNIKQSIHPEQLHKPLHYHNAPHKIHYRLSDENEQLLSSSI